MADMRLFVTSVLSQKPWSYDSKVVPIPWRQEEEDAIKAKIADKSLTLGYFSCDGEVYVLLSYDIFAVPNHG
jgi:amidase